ncbi:hypothetical protein D9M72_579060 [compost metagenome]
MRDQHGRTSFGHLGKTLEDFVFGSGVERGRRFVKNQHGCFFHIDTGQGYFLPFASRELYSIVKTLAECLFVLIGQLVGYGICHAALGCFFDQRLVAKLGDVAYGNVTG